MTEYAEGDTFEGIASRRRIRCSYWGVAATDNFRWLRMTCSDAGVVVRLHNSACEGPGVATPKAIRLKTFPNMETDGSNTRMQRGGNTQSVQVPDIEKSSGYCNTMIYLAGDIRDNVLIWPLGGNDKLYGGP